MLPGFRFLFAAIVLSMSVLIFGLGAAALLRSAHEEFASLPSRRPPAEPVFTRQNEPPMPTLALLRFDPPVLDKPAPDNKPTENAPAAATSETVTPAEQAPDAAPAEPQKLAALKPPEEPMPAAALKPEIPAEETASATPVMPAEAAASAPNDEVKVATVADIPEPSATPATPTTDRLSLEGNIAATKIATLGGPAVIIEENDRREYQRRQTGPQRDQEAERAARPGATTHRSTTRPAGGAAGGGSGRSTAGQPVRANGHRTHDAIDTLL